MREVFGEILEKMIILELLPFFVILDVANAISRKVQVSEAKNFYSGGSNKLTSLIHKFFLKFIDQL